MYSVLLLGDEPVRIRNLRPNLAVLAPVVDFDFETAQLYPIPNAKNDKAAQRQRAAKKRRKAKAGAA